MAYQFLSPEWLDAARAIRAKYADDEPATTTTIRMNQYVTDVPGRDDAMSVFLDTSSGHFELDEGELEAPDVTVTTDWQTARAIFVGKDIAAAMSAFLEGRIKIQGDLMALISSQSAMLDEGAMGKVAAEIVDITE